MPNRHRLWDGVVYSSRSSCAGQEFVDGYKHLYVPANLPLRCIFTLSYGSPSSHNTNPPFSLCIPAVDQRTFWYKNKKVTGGVEACAGGGGSVRHTVWYSRKTFSTGSTQHDNLIQRPRPPQNSKLNRSLALTSRSSILGEFASLSCTYVGFTGQLKIKSVQEFVYVPR